MLDYIWLKINFRSSSSSSKRRKSSGLTRETLLKSNSIRSVSRGVMFGLSHVEEFGPGIHGLRQKSVNRPLFLNEYGKTDKLYL